MIHCARILGQHLRESLASGLASLGVEVWVKTWVDRPLRARDAGWTAITLTEVWDIRRALAVRIEPRVTKMWAIGLAVLMGLLITFMMTGFVLYRIGLQMHVNPSVM